MTQTTLETDSEIHIILGILPDLTEGNLTLNQFIEVWIDTNQVFFSDDFGSPLVQNNPDVVRLIAQHAGLQSPPATAYVQFDNTLDGIIVNISGVFDTDPHLSIRIRYVYNKPISVGQALLDRTFTVKTVNDISSIVKWLQADCLGNITDTEMANLGLDVASFSEDIVAICYEDEPKRTYSLLDVVTSMKFDDFMQHIGTLPQQYVS